MTSEVKILVLQADRDNAPAMRLYASRGGISYPKDIVMFTFELNPNLG